MQEQDNTIINRTFHTPTRSWGQRLLALAVIIAIVAFGFFVSRHLMKTKPQATRKPPAKMSTLVETIPLSLVDTRVIIKAFGRVMPAREVELMAQVSGEVTYTHPNLLPGGIIEAGEVVVRLDDLDYTLALRRKENALVAAQADLRMEQGNQTVAANEWQLINTLTDDIDTSSEDLALRRPQLAKAKTAIETAITDIDKAKLDIERTVITSPFRAIVREKNVSAGSLISGQTVIANLIGVDHFWAELSIPMEQLAWLTLPHGEKKGADIAVYAIGKEAYRGRMIKMLPDLDPDGLMARVLMEIDEPMALEGGKPPLPIGSFINAEITGKEIENCYRIPRQALREGGTVLLVSAEETLEIKPVSVLWTDADWAFVARDGLRPGAGLIVSKVAAPIAGMPLKISSPATDR